MSESIKSTTATVKRIAGNILSGALSAEDLEQIGDGGFTEQQHAIVRGAARAAIELSQEVDGMLVAKEEAERERRASQTGQPRA